MIVQGNVCQGDVYLANERRLERESALDFACSGDACADREEGGSALGEAVGIDAGVLSCFEMGDERCEPADCVGALESVGLDWLVVVAVVVQ